MIVHTTRNTKRFLFYLVVLFCSYSTTPNAQVNTERTRPKPKPGLHGAVEGDVNWMHGNVEFLRIGTALKLHHHSPIHRPMLHARYALARTPEDTFLHQAWVHGRWTAMWLPQIGSELFAQYQFDSAQNLQSRVVTGAGVRWAIVKQNTLQLYASSGYMFESETLQNLPEQEPHPSTTMHHRWSNNLYLQLNLSKTASFSNSLYIQPRFDAPDDFRLLNETDLNFKLWSSFRVILGLRLRYDSRPPSFLKTTDIQIQNKLQFAF
ncbi:MAG: DUF481 domain-containing protein [Myxococcota bacterium]